MIKEAEQNYHKKFPNPEITQEAKVIIDFAEEIFGGIDDLHNRKGVEKILKRYINLKPELAKFEPVRNRINQKK